MPRAVAGVVNIGDFHTLPDIGSFDLESWRNTVMSDMQVNLISPRGSRAILEGDAVGASAVEIGAGVFPMIDITALRRQKLKHGSISKIKGIRTIACRA